MCSADHQESVLSSMQTIMVVLLEESEDVREDLLFVILSVLGRNKSVSTSSLSMLIYCTWFNCLLIIRKMDIAAIIELYLLKYYFERELMFL